MTDTQIGLSVVLALFLFIGLYKRKPKKKAPVKDIYDPTDVFYDDQIHLY
jgi:hypothetical protein